MTMSTKYDASYLPQFHNQPIVPKLYGFHIQIVSISRYAHGMQFAN